MDDKNLTQEERQRLHEKQIQEKIDSEKRKKLIKKISIYSILIIIVAAIIYIPLSNSKNPGEFDDFAKCLTEKGAKEYGAFWCPNCVRQKEMFGKSFQYVTYIECDARGTNAQPQLCDENGITGYPTWIINGTKYTGTQSLEELSRISGCLLPQ